VLRNTSQAGSSVTLSELIRQHADLRVDRKINPDLKIGHLLVKRRGVCATIRAPFRLFLREVWTTPSLKPFYCSEPCATFVCFVATVENHGISCFSFGGHKQVRWFARAHGRTLQNCESLLSQSLFTILPLPRIVAIPSFDKTRSSTTQEGDPRSSRFSIRTARNAVTLFLAVLRPGKPQTQESGLSARLGYRH
jgi:hypothetical protein